MRFAHRPQAAPASVMLRLFLWQSAFNYDIIIRVQHYKDMARQKHPPILGGTTFIYIYIFSIENINLVVPRTN